jgi:hypothetical protein
MVCQSANRFSSALMISSFLFNVVSSLQVFTNYIKLYEYRTHIICCLGEAVEGAYEGHEVAVYSDRNDSYDVHVEGLCVSG